MDFDPFHPAFVVDPYREYRRLQRRPKATWSDVLQGWCITRYADVRQILRDHALFSSDEGHARWPRRRRTSNPSGRNLIGSDPPTHARLRRVAVHAFRSPAGSTWEAEILKLVRPLVRRCVRRRDFDLMADIATPLPIAVVADILGLGATELHRLGQWSETEVQVLAHDSPASEVDALERSSREMHDFFRERVAKVRRDRMPDVIGRMAHPGAGKAGLADDELVAFAVLLLRGGTLTATHLIGNAVQTLLQNPGAVEHLRARPDRIAPCIEELLRLAGPIQGVFRIARRRVSVHGARIEAGDRVWAILAAANRDRSVFPEPDSLDFDRAAPEHLAFGIGIHQCLGASLARIELRLVLEALLDESSALEIAEAGADLTYAWSWSIRGLAALPLRATPKARRSRRRQHA